MSRTAWTKYLVLGVALLSPAAATAADSAPPPTSPASPNAPESERWRPLETYLGTLPPEKENIPPSPITDPALPSLIIETPDMPALPTDTTAPPHPMADDPETTDQPATPRPVMLAPAPPLLRHPPPAPKLGPRFEHMPTTAPIPPWVPQNSCAAPVFDPIPLGPTAPALTPISAPPSSSPGTEATTSKSPSHPEPKLPPGAPQQNAAPPSMPSAQKSPPARISEERQTLDALLQAVKDLGLEKELDFLGQPSQTDEKSMLTTPAPQTAPTAPMPPTEPSAP